MLGVLGLVVIDRIWPYFFPLPQYLNKQISRGYHSNYRNYFEKVEKNGRADYFVPADNKKIPSPNDKYKGISVLTIGDSFTYGQGVKRSDTYSAWLNRLSNDQVRAQNEGKIGINIDRISKSLLNYPSHKFQNFDYIIYGFCPNDIHNKVPENFLDFDFEGYKKGLYGFDYPLHWDFINLRTTVIDKTRSSFQKSLSRYSNIAEYFFRKRQLQKISKNTIEYYKKMFSPDLNKLGWDHFFERLAKMKELADQKKSKFVFLAFPLMYWPNTNYFLNKEFDHFLKAVRNRGIQVIDLRESFFKYQDSELWVHPVDQHPNDLAHKLAAKEILKFIGL